MKQAGRSVSQRDLADGVLLKSALLIVNGFSGTELEYSS